MTIPLPNLDDRRFADLVQELRTLIPRYAPEWTDHNASDPGITLIELFAWLSEALMYRINQVTDASEARFLELLGASFEPAKPASVNLHVIATTLPTQPYFAGEVLTATSENGDAPIRFITAHDLVLRESVEGGAKVYTGNVNALQMAHVSGDPIGVSNGERFQVFRLGRPHVVPAIADTPTSLSIAPEIRVDGELWLYRQNLLVSKPGDRHFMVEPRLNSIRFGDGGRDSRDPGQGAGLIPGKGAMLTSDYYYTLGKGGSVDASVGFVFDRVAAGELSVSVTGTPTAGLDPVDLEEARERANELLRTRVRAITADDFEEIVLKEPQFSLARVKCVPGVDLDDPDSRAANQDDFVSIIVVPHSSAPKPMPSPELLSQVSGFIDVRRLITTRHCVVAPEYTEVTLSAEVVATAQAQDERVRDRIIANLETFFDPFTGGAVQGGSGWPFGRDVHKSEVFQVIEDSEGVDHVERLVLKTRDASSSWSEPAGGERITIPARNLVSFDADAVVIRVKGEH